MAPWQSAHVSVCTAGFQEHERKHLLLSTPEWAYGRWLGSDRFSASTSLHRRHTAPIERWEGSHALPLQLVRLMQRRAPRMERVKVVLTSHRADAGSKPA